MTNGNLFPTSSYGRARAAEKARKAAGLTTAIQMVARFFGGKLDAFFGFAQKQQHGFRGATPSRASVREAQAAVAAMKLKPRSKPKAPSKRDMHRAAVLLATPGKPIATFDNHSFIN